MRLGTKFCVAALLVAAVLVGGASGQTTSSGALSGVVIDKTNAVVPDAAVEITDIAKGTTDTTRTNGEGVYQFSFLRPGRYTLSVSHPGFQEERRSVAVQLGPPVTVNITLLVAKTSSEITVTDEAPIIQAENADVSTTMNQKQISEVPNSGNDLTYVVQTAPGVVMNTDFSNGSNFSILGMPANSYLFTTDGMSNNGPGALGLLLGQNEIQEATIVSTGYSGQFGGAAGGNINYITKSGTNGLHGNAQYYWNGSAFNANYWFNNAWNVPRPFSIANQWAGSLGGPIKKDKLFFFFDSEGLRLQVSSTTRVAIPSPQFEDATMKNIDSDSRFGGGSATHAFYRKMFDLYDSSLLGPGVSAVQDGFFLDPLGCAGFVDPKIDPNDPHGLGKDVPCSVSFIKNRGRPSQDRLTSGRVDWNASRSDRVFLRLERDGGVSAASNDPINSMFDQDGSNGWWKGDVVETRPFGPSVATQFLMGISLGSGMAGVKNLAKSLATFPTGLNFNGLPFFSNLGDSGTEGDSYRLYDFSGDLVKTWGQQKLGLGANFEQTHWNLSVDGWGGAGFLVPQSLLAFYQGGLDPVNPETDFTLLFQQFPSRTLQRIASNHFGLYGQDEWHVRKNLSLTFALRAEHQSNPVCENRCFARFARPFELISHDAKQPYKEAIVTNQRQAFIRTDRILWSPRFSFAWQPFGVTHNTVLRGGIGIFYDSLVGLTSWLYGNPPLVNSFNAVKNNLTPGESSSLFKDADASNKAFVHGFPLGETLADFQHEVPNFSPAGLIVPQQRLHSPQYQRWSLVLQQALGNATSFGVAYFGHHGIHEIVQNSAVNAWGFGSLPAGRCSDAIPDCAPDPRFGGVTELATTAVSNYNGMVASFKHRMSRWSQGLLQVNYTYGHAFDEVSNGGLSNFTLYATASPQNPNNLRDAYGPADYDVRHSFNANYVWELPLKAALGGHGPSSLMNGWQVSGTFFAHTGFPYTVVDPQKSLQLASKNYFGAIYAVPIGPLGSQPPCGSSAALTPSGAPQPCMPEELLYPPNSPPTVNPGALFVQSGCETDFNRGHLPGKSGPCTGAEVTFAQGRNYFRGLGYFSTDFTIMKSTKISHWENSELRIGFQFFNILNHPNFGLPFNELSDPLLGVIGYMAQSSTTLLGNAQTSTSFLGTNQNGAARMIQLKAELKF